ncbi:MAG: hypothetical protein ABL876_03375 [Chitinophagaceae bacterium]
MKSLISKSMLLFVMAVSLLSFSAKPGGEGFEIYVGNKLMIQRFGGKVNTVQSLQLGQQTANENLAIKYHHCGRAGKNRVITIKDGQNAVLKEFHYADSKDAASVMILGVKDLVSLRKGTIQSLKLFYASSELPNGRQLTTINF